MKQSNNNPLVENGMLSSAYTSLPFEITSGIKEGRVLVGDDFDLDKLTQWFAQEKEAFYSANAGSSEVDPWYAYMRYVNDTLAFSKIDYAQKEPKSLLVIGPGSGIEVDAFARKHPDWVLSFLEASKNFQAELTRRFPKAHVVDPTLAGDIPLGNESQSIVCAFSVLHHIPNVTKVIQEVYRVTKHGGLFFVREPCSSIGDWRYPRSATPNERGISRGYLISAALGAGFLAERKPVPILFEPINKILRKTIGFSFVPFVLLYYVDRLISLLLSFNDRYWRDTLYKKFGPSSYFYIFQKKGKE
jgi:SAM-dependent methyltransferase